MHGTRVQFLVLVDSTWHGATKPVHHNNWVCALEPESHSYWPYVLQLLKTTCLEPVLRNKRSHPNEKPTYRNQEWPSLIATRESLCTAMKIQCNQSKNVSPFFKKEYFPFSLLPPKTTWALFKKEKIVSSKNFNFPSLFTVTLFHFLPTSNDAWVLHFASQSRGRWLLKKESVHGELLFPAGPSILTYLPLPSSQSSHICHFLFQWHWESWSNLGTKDACPGRSNDSEGNDEKKQQWQLFFLHQLLSVNHCKDFVQILLFVVTSLWWV